jgi:flagellar protein FliS
MAIDKYLEAEVLGADPVRLVAILYRGAIEAVGAARRHLSAGAIRERSRQISQAMVLIAELVRSLDHTKGGDLSHSLEELYGYMLRQLAAANAQQIDAPLADVERLLATLLSAWSSLPSPVAALFSYDAGQTSEYESVSHTY